MSVVVSNKLKDALEKVPKSVYSKVIPPQDGSRIDIFVTFVHSDILFSGQVRPALPIRYAHKFIGHDVPKTLAELNAALNPPANDADDAPEPLPYTTEKPKLAEIYAMQYIDDRWYRVQVIEFSECDDVKVIYLDYGNAVWVTYKKLRQLDKKNLFVPCQALYFKLADVEAPPETVNDCFARNEYRIKCKLLLHSLIMDKVVKASVVRSTPTFIEAVIENELGISVAHNLMSACGSIMKHVEVPSLLYL